MSVMSVRERYPEAVEAVRNFFTQFYGLEIVLSEDVADDLMLFHVGKADKIVAVSTDFLAHSGPQEIRESLAAWNVAHLSRTLERGCRLKITSEGPEEERN